VGVVEQFSVAASEPISALTGPRKIEKKRASREAGIPREKKMSKGGPTQCELVSSQTGMVDFLLCKEGPLKSPGKKKELKRRNFLPDLTGARQTSIIKPFLQMTGAYVSMVKKVE